MSPFYAKYTQHRKSIIYPNMNRQPYYLFSFENPALSLLVRKGHGFVLHPSHATF